MNYELLTVKIMLYFYLYRKGITAANMEDVLYQAGYPGLFIVSFLAATLLPLGSEFFVITMILSGYNPLLTFVTATVGNSLGSITNYYVGRYGANKVCSRYINIDAQKKQKVERIYKKWGSPALFFAWVPIVGDPLTVVAGALNLNLYLFTFWVVLGKAFRYALVILTTETF